jgi:hypothetical protein
VRLLWISCARRFRFRISGTNVIGAFRARNAAPEAPAATPVSITNNLSALCQREVELADAQACQVDARATAEAALHAIRAAEDRAMMAERAAAQPALAE